MPYREGMLKTRKRKPRPQQMTVEQFDRDRKKAIAAARKPGGLLVVDSDGKVRFHMSIPCEPLPADPW